MPVTGSTADVTMARYSLLRHTDAPDDPSGCHFDLLLEDGDACRTWRLQTVPSLGGRPQAAVPLTRHRLVWLEPRSAAVSGGRGWAERVMAGHFQGQLPHNPADPVDLSLLDGELRGQLRIKQGLCSLRRT